MSLAGVESTGDLAAPARGTKASAPEAPAPAGSAETPTRWPHGNRNDVWWSEDGQEWHEVPTPWAPRCVPSSPAVVHPSSCRQSHRRLAVHRHAASAFVHDGSLWMVAGNNMQPDVWRLSRQPPKL